MAHAFVLARDSIVTSDLPAELSSDPRRTRSEAAGADSMPMMRSAEPAESSITMSVGSTIEKAERALIMATLEQLGGNKERTAAMLGISVKTLYNRRNRYGKGR